MVELTRASNYGEEELETAEFYARQVVDEERYNDFYDRTDLPTYEQVEPGVMVALAISELNMDRESDKWSFDEFIEHSKELGGETAVDKYWEKRVSSQLGDEPVDNETLDHWDLETHVQLEDEAPSGVPADSDHRWVIVTDTRGITNIQSYDAYLPVVDMEDEQEDSWNEDEDDMPAFDPWP